MRNYTIKDQEENMVFSDCISDNLNCCDHDHDTKSEEGACCTASCSVTDYHTAYEKSECCNDCNEEESNLMNETNDHTLDNTDSMSESATCLTDRNTTMNQESFINSSRRASISDSQVDIDVS
jgi:hypothetical protein